MILYRYSYRKDVMDVLNKIDILLSTIDPKLYLKAEGLINPYWGLCYNQLEHLEAQ